MPWPTSVHVLRKGGDSPKRMQEQEDLTAKMLPRQRKTGGATGRRKGKEVLVVEQSGKKAKAGCSNKDIAAGTNHQDVAVADKQDGTNRQYCKIHRTKGHDLQSCKKVEQLVEQQKAEYE